MTQHMTTLTRSEEPVATTPSPAYRLRRVVGACCLPAAFAVMIVGSALLDPLDDSANEATTIHDAVGHAGQIAALGWAEVLSAFLVLGGLMTVVGAVRGRGAGWANATGVLAILSSAGLLGIALNHFVVSGLTSSNLGLDARIEALTRFHHAGGPIVAFIMISALGFVTAALAGWRSGLTSRLVLVPAAAFLVISFAPGEAAQYAAMAAGLVMTAWLAGDLVRA